MWCVIESAIKMPILRFQPLVVKELGLTHLNSAFLMLSGFEKLHKGLFE
jgi:hypothetical protein